MTNSNFAITWLLNLTQFLFIMRRCAVLVLQSFLIDEEAIKIGPHYNTFYRIHTDIWQDTFLHAKAKPVMQVYSLDQCYSVQTVSYEETYI